MGLFYYDSYPITLLFSSVLFVGLICTIFTEARFFDKQFQDKKLVRDLSLRILVFLFFITLSILYFEHAGKGGLFLLAGLSGFNIFYEKYLDQLAGKKKPRWTFKW